MTARKSRSWGRRLAPIMAASVLMAHAGRADDGRAATPPEDEACWKLLPPIESGGGGPLPNWVKAMAGSLPRTAAALLELDFAHRTRGPLDPKLRAAMRRVAAGANGCAYTAAYAEADARRSGLDDEALGALSRGDWSSWPEAERQALGFARKMTVESSRVTDEEFAALVGAFGERKAAAMVLGMAHANFQDRLVQCLGVPVEDGGPLPPIEVRFAPGTMARDTTPPPPPSNDPLPQPAGRDLVADEPGWAALSFDALQRKLEDQRSRPTRLRIPPWDEMERGLPKGFTRANRIVWNLICLGYAPELAMPWETLMLTSSAENGRRLDRTFTLSVFWVVTRAIDCPYCMGHCEMNWEVAGLAPERIAERTRLLGGDDW